MDKVQLILGILVEKEHTNNVRVARDIAVDHLNEDPEYYSKLYRAGLIDGSNGAEAFAKKHFGEIADHRVTASSLLSETKVLSVFDADDTLINSDHWIYVNDASGKRIKQLNTAEFAVYKPVNGETFDFSDFSRKLRNPQIIKKNVDILRKQLEKASKQSNRKVVILTARRIGLPVRSFLKTIGIDVEVIAVGSSDPYEKKKWIEQQILRGYNKVYFSDDSIKNINAVKELQDEYPNVTVNVYHVQHPH